MLKFTAGVKPIVVRTYEDLKKVPEWPHLTDTSRYWLKWAYHEKKHWKVSDGISWLSQLRFVKHPAGVLHDALYYYQIMTRKNSDKMFKQVMAEWGYPNYSKVYYRGVRTFGWIYWYKRRIKIWLGSSVKQRGQQ